MAGDKNTRFHPQVVHWASNNRKQHVPLQEMDTPPPFQSNERTRKPINNKKDSKEAFDRVEALSEDEKEIKFEEDEWKATVTTERALHNARIIMVIYGNKENSTTILLNCKECEDSFQDGSRDEFKINLKGIGKITKLRLELFPDYNAGLYEWKPKEVKLQHMKTKSLFKFKFNCWISNVRGNKQLMRELPAIRPGQRVLQVINYQVEVHTANEPGADTEANVYLTLFGGIGDTGKRHLAESDKPEKFQEGQVDVFTIEAVSLGAIKRCLVSCDGKGPGEGWKCEKIVVRESEDSPKEFIFPCDKWMDSSVGDGRLQRLLKARRLRVEMSNDGRHDFFHRLTGDKPGGLQMVMSDGEDSDPGFFKRFRANNSRVQDAVFLSSEDTMQTKPYQHEDGSLKLPRIDSPIAQSDSKERNRRKSNGNLVLPDIYESSHSYNNVKRKHSLKRLQKENRRRKQHARSNAYSDSEEEEEQKPKYPWESNQNRKIRNEALSQRKRLKKRSEENPNINISRIAYQRRENDSFSDVEPSESDINDDMSVYSSKSGKKKYLKNKIKSQESESDNKHETESEPKFEPVSAVYMGNVNKSKIKAPPKTDNSKQVPSRNESSTKGEISRSTSRFDRRNTNKFTSRDSSNDIPRHIKYNPRVKKGDFPWENRRTKDKPKTALVKPTQRDDLNQSAKERTAKKRGDRSRTFTKPDAKKTITVDSHFPSRVELRLMARRARRQKQQQQQEQEQHKRLHPLVSKKLYVGIGLVDERLKKRNEIRNNQKQTVHRKKDEAFPTKLDNVKYTGASRTEQRALLKQQREKQKQEEKEKLLAKQENEKKPKIPVYMPPVQKEKQKVTYGVNYHSKKAMSNASKASSSQRNRTNPSNMGNRNSDQALQSRNTNPNADKSSKAQKTPGPISHEDSDIWDYFASVVDNLKSIEAREPINNEEYTELCI